MATVKCLNFQNVVNGTCVDNRDVTAMGWAIQLSVPLFIIPTSALLMFGFVCIVIFNYNLFRVKGRAVLHPLRNLIVPAACLHAMTRLMAIIAQCVNIARLQGIIASNAFLIPWAFSKLDGIGTVIIALHFLTFNFLKKGDLRITNRGYSWTVKLIILTAAVIALLYFAYIIAITNIYFSQNPKATRWGWHIMAIGYGLDAVVAIVMLGVVKYVRDRQVPNLYVTHSAKILNIWIGATIFTCCYQIVNIYWFELSKSIPSMALTPATRDIMTRIQIPTQRSLSLRINQNYLDHFQLFLNWLILSWKSMELLPGSELYYLFHPTEWEERCKSYYPENPSTLDSDLSPKNSARTDGNSSVDAKDGSSSPIPVRTRTNYSRTSKKTEEV